MKGKICAFIIGLAAAAGLSGCIEDSFDTSAQAQPAFSVDSLDMGVQFTDNPSPTSMLMIYNRHDKLINLSDVGLRDGQYFRINVDGQSGSRFSNVEIRPNDSIYVFVEVTLPPVATSQPTVMSDELQVTTNGVTKTLKIVATAQNVERHRKQTITGNVSFSAEVPHVIFDTLRVAPGAVLTLEPGAQLLFHDKGNLLVEGTLLSRGTAQQPVRMTGDRTGNVVADISFEVMSNQWGGVKFARQSKGNSLSHTEIINTCGGVVLDSLAEVDMVNSRLYNSGTFQLMCMGENRLTALGCEISNAASALVAVGSGNFLFDRCTIANWYLFKWPDMDIVTFTDPENTHAQFCNSIIYGRDRSICDYENPMERDIWFRRCMFKEAGANDERYIDCLWDADPMLDYSLTEYTFDYWPQPDSPAIGAAMAEYDSPQLPPLDRRGMERGLNLGAYASAPPRDED